MVGVTSSYARRLRRLASDPAGGQEGELYYNTADEVVRVRKAGGWEDLTPSAPGGGGSSVLVAAPNAVVLAEDLKYTAPGYASFTTDAVFVAPHDFTLDKMKVRTGGTQGDDALSIQVLKNGVAASTHSIPTGSAAGTYSFSPAVSFAEGDTLQLRFENAATDASATVRSVSLSVS